MTAAAMKLNDGPTVSVRLNDEYSQKELMLIYVDNQVLNFSDTSQRWHAYEGKSQRWHGQVFFNVSKVSNK